VTKFNANRKSKPSECVLATPLRRIQKGDRRVTIRLGRRDRALSFIYLLFVFKKLKLTRRSFSAVGTDDAPLLPLDASAPLPPPSIPSPLPSSPFACITENPLSAAASDRYDDLSPSPERGNNNSGAFDLSGVLYIHSAAVCLRSIPVRYS